MITAPTLLDESVKLATPPPTPTFAADKLTLSSDIPGSHHTVDHVDVFKPEPLNSSSNTGDQPPETPTGCGTADTAATGATGGATGADELTGTLGATDGTTGVPEPVAGVVARSARMRQRWTFTCGLARLQIVRTHRPLPRIRTDVQMRCRGCGPPTPSASRWEPTTTWTVRPFAERAKVVSDTR